jgi:hypothetical protein
MLEAYKVAIRISLVEGVTAGLGLISRHLRRTDEDAKGLQKRLDSISKMGAISAGLAGAGSIGLKLFDGPIAEAMKYERAIGSLRQMGLGDAQIADARKFAEATNIIGTSVLDRIRLFTEAEGSFRESGLGGMRALQAAKTMTPLLGTYEVATGLLSGDKKVAAEQGMRSLNKTVEIMGGLDDTKRAQAIVDGVFKATQSSGRMVDERQLKQFVAYGSSATNQLGLRTIFGGLEPIIGELGGSTTAVGLRTAYTRTNGMMAMMPKRLREEMQRLGLASAGGKQQTDDMARLQATDVIGYAQNIVARYAKAGITSRTDMERENAIIFGTNGSKVFNKIMSQMPVLSHSLAAYDKARAPGAMVNDRRNGALLAPVSLEKQEADLKLRIGKDILPLYVHGLEIAATALGALNSLPNPVLKFGTYATAGLSVLALAGGGVASLATAAQALDAALIAGGSKFQLLPLLGKGLIFMSTGIRAAALAMVANPIGLAVTGVVALGFAAYELWKHWDVVGPKLKMLWDGITSGVTWMINKVIGLLNHLPGVNIGPVGGASPRTNVVPPAHTYSSRGADVYLDGKKVGQAVWTHVSDHMTRAASRPNIGTSGFNPGMGPLRPTTSR